MYCQCVLPTLEREKYRILRLAVILTYLTYNTGPNFQDVSLANVFRSGMQMMEFRHLPSWLVPKLCLNSHHTANTIIDEY